jgi:hypothetical protein
MKTRLPKDWRKRRDLPPRSGRIYVEKMEAETPDVRWQVNDAAYTTCLGFRTKAEATDAASFARAYIKEHGDIDFCSFPYSIDDELHYCNIEDIERWWAVTYPAEGPA